MPQVDAIRPCSHPGQWSAVQQRRRPEAVAVGAGCQHQHRCRHRQNRGDPWEAGEIAEPRGRRHDDCQAQPTGTGPDGARNPVRHGAGNCQGCSGEKFPGPGRQEEERCRLMLWCHPDAQDQRRHQQNADQRRGQPAGPSTKRGRGEQQQRPAEVELLLEGERPEVQQRRRRELRRQVVVLAMGEHDVDGERRRGEPVTHEISLREWIEHEASDDEGGNQDDE